MSFFKISIKMKLSQREQFINYYKSFFSSDRDFDQFIQSLSLKNPRVLRCRKEFFNQVKTNWKQEGLKFEELPWCKNVLAWPQGIEHFTDLPLHEKSYFYAMNASSLLPVLALNPQPGEKILDACAAPGGKATFIYDLIDGEHLIANDTSNARRTKMKTVFQEFHLDKCEILGRKAEIIFKNFPKYFDKILIDAPCSSEKHVFQSESHLNKWSPSRPKRLAQEQYALLCGLSRALKKGGRMVFSTCAFTPQENESVVCRFLKKHHQTMRLVESGLNFEFLENGFAMDFDLYDRRLIKRVNPVNKVDLDPMFVAVFEKFDENK
jgi:16S rRNA C967 or C1407 C5-methylase (RsmB/RsmF family)